MEKIDQTRNFIPLQIAVLTLSDTRTPENDKSGQFLAECVEKAGHLLVDRKISKDDIESIQTVVEAWIKDPGVNVILSTGGTGFTARDVTIEAIEPLFEKKMDGFSVLFHQLSYDKIGTSTIQSRATGGMVNDVYIFCLPGSPGACKDAWDGILVHQLDYRHAPCNFVEIMPRLDKALQRNK